MTAEEIYGVEISLFYKSLNTNRISTVFVQIIHMLTFYQLLENCTLAKSFIFTHIQFYH